MSSIADADDAVLKAAYAVLEGNQSAGTKAIRRLENEDGTDSVYRVDPDADPSEVDEVRPNGEFPDSEAVLWRADRDLVEREVERRDLEG